MKIVNSHFRRILVSEFNGLYCQYNQYVICFFREADMFFVKRLGVLAFIVYTFIGIQAFAQSWTKMESPEGIYGYDILSFSAQDIYVVGYKGAIMHFDGYNWQKMLTPNRLPIWSIWGPDPNNIYAVGGNGVILYYNGNSWSTMDSGTRQWLYDIWGTDMNTIYAVGAGVILKYNGSTWTHMMIGDEYKSFFTIYGNHENDVYAAGDSKRIYHYNGVGWTEIKAVEADQIWGIFTAGMHIFAAGTLVDGHSTTYHFNGLQWVDTQLPVTTDLWGLWGSSENDLYCVGDSGTIVHFDGHQWHNQSIDENIRLRGIHGQLGTAYILSETGAVLKKEANYHIKLGHVSGHAGETLKIPISLTNTNMNQMEGIDVTIDYDPDILSVQSAELTGGILSDKHYTLETELSQAGRVILVFGATQNCEAGSGVVAYLICHVLDDIGRTGNFTDNQWHQPQSILISKAEINENVASVHNGSVTVMNYPPIISDFENIIVQEDQGPFDIPFHVHDTETSVDALTITVGHTGHSNFFSEPITINGVHSQRSLHLVPSPNTYGQIEIWVSISDGIHHTQKTISCSIQAVNDLPIFEKGPDITVNEDDDRQIIQNWATKIAPGPSNEADQSISFITTTMETDLFEELPQVLPNGSLVFKPRPQAFGQSEVEIVLKDNCDGLSSKQLFTINILPINDPPSFTPGKNITVMEDSGEHLVKQWAKDIFTGNIFEKDQEITFTVTPEDPTLFDQIHINSNGDLFFSTSLNMAGVSQILITIEDNGGNDNGGVNTSESYTSVITIMSQNDPPSFVKGSDVSLFKNSGFQSFENWATQIKSGPPNEKDQEIIFVVSNNANHLFDIQPGITNEGTLTFKPKPELTGEALVNIYVEDKPLIGTSKISIIQKARIIIMEYPSISGKVSYFSNDQPVRNVELLLAGDHQYETQTDEQGQYEFKTVLPGTYLLTAKKTDDLKGLSGTDAASIFRHASESDSLNCFEMIAADVTQSGRIGGTDASRVARYRAGLTSCLNDNCLEWVFTPASTYPRLFLSEGAIVDKDQCQEWPPISYSKGMHLYQVKTSLTNMNFVAFRLGDTSGNWTPDISPEKRNMMNTLSTQEVQPIDNGTVLVPLESEDIVSISGIDFSVTYDSNRLIPLGTSFENTVLDNKMYNIHVNMKQSGIITGVISATRDLVTASGKLLFLKFQWIDQVESNVDDFVHISVKEFECNEVELPLKRYHVRMSEKKSTTEEVLTERLRKFDIHMDNKKGLEEAIDALRSISESEQ
jgi:hypothetical protein